MIKLVECIPNFSEGRRKDVIDAIVAAVCSVNGVTLLDYSSDYDHNRSVLTFIGEPERAAEAAFLACKKAAELIDMTTHTGGHPRIGATDVIPFVPLKNTSMEECIALAQCVAKRIADELCIPTYLYESAAKCPERKNLANVRKGQCEGLRELIKTDATRFPDFGLNEMHCTAGATAVGARNFLIAFNINLSTDDIDIAKKIARAVRGSNGGFINVKAMGVMLEERNVAQVSMNLVNFIDTPIQRAFDFVKTEAERYGVNVIGSEVIGLVPMDALIDVAEHYLRIEDFSRDQVLERRLLDMFE